MHKCSCTKTQCLSAPHKGNISNEFKREENKINAYTHTYIQIQWQKCGYANYSRVLISIEVQTCMCVQICALLCLSVFLHEIDHIFQVLLIKDSALPTVICPKIALFYKIASLLDVSFIASVCNCNMAYPADKLSSYYWLWFVLIPWIGDICTCKFSQGLTVCDS